MDVIVIGINIVRINIVGIENIVRFDMIEIVDNIFVYITSYYFFNKNSALAQSRAHIALELRSCLPFLNVKG
jgi:hypothetical protein